MSVTGPAGADVRALAHAAQDADGVAPFSEQTLLNLDARTDRGGTVRHLRLDDERAGLVGYAQLDGHSAELAVHPSHRRRGHGAELLRAVLRADPDTRVWAHGPHPAAAVLADMHGLRTVRELWQMAATPPPAPLPVVPADLALTTFDADRDSDDWVAVNARAFATHPEQGRLTRADLDARVAEPWFDPSVLWLARDAGSGVLWGSMWLKIEGRVGEIYVLGVDPSAQGRGVGTLLTAVAMHTFGERALARVELYVEADNHAAIATYRRAGFERVRADLQYSR